MLESWIDEHAGHPIYRYGKQQVIARYDPSALEEDLGDDANDDLKVFVLDEGEVDATFQ